ncbi:hypothetical protein BRARA_I02418 [Brassica rapa]|uniref:GRF-type domain-containing protein n=1 Tax=Brassica campestris TaxID=3711 RepID=A0A397Y236_BRACM|nr:hypothetical protein BRARA_I02418 [Brassica rapa]
MDYQFPKRFIEEGAETKIDKINNTCRRTILGTLKVVLRDEYQEVLKDPVFGPILAIVENKLIYSGKVIHSFICKQLKDLRVFIPHEFIRLVMDFEKMRMYPWGLRAYDELLASIFKAREDVHLKNSYVLDGFSYAFQIWIMEAIPDIGSMVGKKIKNNLTKVRCRNWKGSGKVSYQDITSLESNFDKGELFPFISSTGSLDATDNAEFFREDEKNDERVNRIVALISAKQDWKQFTWEVETLPPNMELSDAEEDVEVENVTETPVEEPAVVEEEPAVVTKRGKRKLIDPGVESRKKQLLCQRAAEHNSVVSGDMKTFIEGLFNSSFNSFKELLQKDIQERFDKVDNEMAQLKATVSQITGPSVAVGRDIASEIPCPSATLGKEQEKSSQSPGPSGAKGKGKGKASVSVDPPPLRRSPRPVRKEVKTDDDDMFDFLKNLSQSSTYVDKGTQEFLQDAVGNLSQASHVKGFDPSQKIKDDEPAEWVTPLSSFKPPNWKPPTLKDEELLEDRVHDIDHSLVFVPEDGWAKIIEWSSTSNELKIGPSMLTSVLAARVMGPTEWLLNHNDNSYQPLNIPYLTLKMTNMNHNEGIPSRCWCGKGIVTYVSKTEENPYRRFFRCEIGIQCKQYMTYIDNNT